MHASNKPSVINIVFELLRDAWALVSGLKWLIFLMSALLPIAYLLLLILGLLVLVPHSIFYSIPFYVIAGGISLFVYWTLFTTAYLLGIQQATHEPLSIDYLLQCCGQHKMALASLFFIWMGVAAAFIALNFLFVNPILSSLIYILEIYCKFPLMAFALPLIVRHEFRPIDALQLAFNIMNQHLMVIMASQLIMAGLIFVSAIPLGIGLIWTLPMYYALAGILYKQYASTSQNEIIIAN